MFSAYELDPTFGWVAVHRLPLDDAISFCKHYREQKNPRVAIVPDGEDPDPYLAFVNELYDEGDRCDTCGAPCDSTGCTRNRDHEPALA